MCRLNLGLALPAVQEKDSSLTQSHSIDEAVVRHKEKKSK